MSLNYFVFDGESSLNYGVYIGGQNTYNAPQRDVTKVSIPGRNGDLVQDNGRFLNAQVPYTIVVMDEFRDKTDAIKAWLLSKNGYCKLTDTYHPGTYRMARVSGGINFETSAFNATGKTQVIFDCKPERFLDSGNEIIDVGVWGQTETQTGDIVSFTGYEDMLFRSIEAEILPTQAFNGYDTPWPPGGGKNKLDASAILAENRCIKTDNGEKVTPSASGGTWRSSDYIPVTAGDVLYFGQITSTAFATGTAFYSGTADSPTFVSGVSAINLGRANNVYTIPEGATLMRHSWRIDEGYNEDWETTVYITLNSNPHGWTPYANICPITGETGATVYRTGKNQLSTSFLLQGGINNTGVNTSSGTRVRTSFMSVKPSTDYVASVASGYSVLAAHYYKTKTVDTWISRDAGDGASLAFSTPAECNYIRLLFAEATKTQIVTPSEIASGNPQLELGAAPTTFEPYAGTEYPVTWQTEAGTVYGGTVDVVSGVLTMTHGMMVLDGTQTMTQTTGTNDHIAVTNDNIYKVSQTPLSSQFVGDAPGGGESTPVGHCRLSANLAYINFGFSSPKTPEQWAEELAITPVQVLLQLAAPITYQLTAQQVAVLVGANNVWSDKGDVAVEYSLNPNVVANPTRFASKPKMKVKGSGSGTVTVNNEIITLTNLDGFVYIDSELMNCYKDSVNKNSDVALPNHKFPELEAGRNDIVFSGDVTGVEVQGRWWTI